ncbi:MAG: MarR family transcriptional regulator [Bacteroidota bacterium]
MMIEEERPLSDVYFFWMERAVKAQHKAKNKLFKNLNIHLTSDQWMILKRLTEKEGQTQRELAASLSKDPASLTRSLDILQKESLLERRSADRRSFTVHLTDKGNQLVDRVMPEAIKFREKGIAGVSADEMTVFKKVLDTIYKNFSD